MEQNDRIQRNASPESSEAPTQEGLTAKAPAFQLMASPIAPPVQRVAKSIKDFTIVQVGTTEAEVEGTTEFQQFMDTTSTYQSAMHLSRDEARLACLMMVEANHRGDNVDMATAGQTFADQARARLNPQAGHGVIPRLGMEINEVSESRAQELFDQLATLTFWNDRGEETPIPYHYPIDGCYARAHLMSERLTALGYGSRKQFAVARNSAGTGSLNVQSSYAWDTAPGNTPTVTWWYHVAPIIQVQLPTGQLEDRVMDPSMAANPISVSEWTGMMNPNQFQEMSLAEVETMEATQQDDFAVDSQITYSADRAYFDPLDLGESPTDKGSHRQMNGYRSRITEYADVSGANELAASIRSAIANASVNCSEILKQVNAMNEASRIEFQDRYTTLSDQLKATLSSQDWILVETALNK